MAESLLFVQKPHFLYEGNEVNSSKTVDIKDIPIALENPDSDITWYQSYFVRKAHNNYVGKDDELGPIAVMTVLENEKTDMQQYRVIVSTKKKNDKVILPTKKKMGLSDLLKAVKPEYAHLHKKLVKVSNKAIYNDLVAIENLQTINKYKFGMLLALPGQTDEKDMFCNGAPGEPPNQNFEDFLECIADKITLKGWKKYRAGLDVSFGGTGDYSYYTTVAGDEIEVMFHVSTYLPYTPTDRQQLQRKRQCGNDVVQVVFMDDDKTPFDPECIASHFNHVWAVIQPASKDADGRATSYRVSVCRKDNVPPFGPELPSPAIFRRGPDLREFLLTKLINGERSCMHSEVFIQLSERTKEIMLSNLHDTFSKNTKDNKAKEEEIMQKLEASIKKNAHAIKSTEVFTAEDLASHNEAVTCASSWGAMLLFGTESGLYLMKGGGTPVKVLAADRVSALHVTPSLDTVVWMAGKKPECFSASLEGLLNSSAEPHKLPVKKLNKMACSADGSLVATCAGKRVTVCRYSGKSTYSIIYESAMPAEVLVLAFIGSLAVVGFRNEYNTIQFATSQLKLLHRAEKMQPSAVSACGSELLLGFDHICFVHDVRSDTPSSSTPIECTQAPTATVTVAPYVLAFTGQHVEVVAAATSRLIQSIDAPRSTFLCTQPTDDGCTNVLACVKDGDAYKIRCYAMATRGNRDEHVLLEASQQLGTSLATLQGESGTAEDSTDSLLSFVKGLRESVEDLQ